MKLSKTTSTFTPEDFRRLDESAAEARAAGPNPHPAAARGAEASAPKGIGAMPDAARLDDRPHYSPRVFIGLVRGIDFLLLCLIGVVVHVAYVAPQVGYELSYAIAIPLMSALAIVAFQTLSINHLGAFRDPVRQGLRIVVGWSIVVLLAIGAVFFLKLESTISRVWILCWYVSATAGLLIERSLIAAVTRHMTRTGRLERRTVIVGGGEAAEALLQDLAKQTDMDLRICGLFDDRSDDRSPHMVAGTPKLGNIDDLVVLARHTRIDLIIFTLPITAEQRLLQMLRKLWVLPIDIRLAAHRNKLKLHPRSYSYIGSVPVLDVFDKPLGDWDVVLKTIFDRVVGALALLALTPLLAVTALAVKLDSPGPILFRQKRYGFNNELIEVYKFRSMYADKLDHKAERLVTRGDPRVTRVGRFIRKTSLDELPQLFNVVFKGNLSLVGPRPHAVYSKAGNRLYDDVVDGYFARHRVRPGITGWAQVNGWRGETDTLDKIQRRVEHDLAYIENWSIFFDMYILLVTPFALIKNENAY